jgi:hypothetical protein
MADMLQPTHTMPARAQNVLWLQSRILSTLCPDINARSWSPGGSATRVGGAPDQINANRAAQGWLSR